MCLPNSATGVRLIHDLSVCECEKSAKRLILAVNFVFLKVSSFFASIAAEKL